MDLIQKGVEKAYISFDEDQNYITYLHQGKKRNYTNPEEQIQAETFLKLIFSYGYPAERIAQFKSVTMGSSTKEVDIIVYNDDECKQPYIIVECKKDSLPDIFMKNKMRR